MSKLQLTFACGNYDRTVALREGIVQPQGIDLIYIVESPDPIFRKMLRFHEYDASEMSLASYTIARSHGRTDFIAIPVFTSRVFRHSAIYVNTQANIREPRDLIGKRLGVPEYQMTAAVWVRGILLHEYGIRPEQIEWFTEVEEREIIDWPQGVRVTWLGPGTNLEALLEAGEIDALACPRQPDALTQQRGTVARLFRDFRAVEQDYYRRTKLFPIMHTVVIRSEIYQRHPWVANSLYKAFVEAKQRCFNEMYQIGSLRVSLPWVVAEIDQEREVLGSDLWPYGLEANRHVLETTMEFLYEQGLTKERMKVEELFAPNVTS